jgi:DNA polymerase-3 subunit alpha
MLTNTDCLLQSTPKLAYANLHTRSTFSTGQSIGTSSDIIARAKEAGLVGAALTDTSTLAGVLDFYRECKDSSFDGAIGTEVFYFDDVYDSKHKHSNLILIAKSQLGYQNLCKLTSLSNSDSRRDSGPRLSVEDLREYKQDLICLTGNAYGPFGKGFMNSDISMEQAFKDGIKRIEILHRIFGDDLYLELTLNNEQFAYEKVGDFEFDLKQKFSSNPQIIINSLLIGLSSKLCIKYLISSDAHMPKPQQKVLQDIVVKNVFGKVPYAESRYIMSIDEMRQKISRYHPYITEEMFQNACKNSIEAFEKVKSIELKFRPQVVNYPTIFHPLGTSGQSKLELVLAIVNDNKRVNLADPIYFNRLQYEIKAITQNGRIDLIDYFLVLEDLCRWCRDNGIIVGPGRGSGAGSLLNYCLRITHLDPIKYGLLFERFISEGRIQKGTLPDVDLDFSDQEAVRQYLIEKYGDDRVKSIGVFQTLKLKNALKDALKALHPEVEFFHVNMVSTKLPKQEQGESEQEYFARSLEESQLFRDMMEKYPDVKSAIGQLIGFNRQPGVHPCGLAISEDPLHDFAPLRYLKDKWVLEYTADDAAFAGIIKYDVLGLTTLKYFKTCLELIEVRHGKKIDIYSIPLDDGPTCKAFERGDTESVFQFNSEVSQSILTKIRVRGVDDLSLVTSVGRPGPMANGQHFEFVKRANNDCPPTPPHPALSDILHDSYGIMIYQEGVMKASQILGGFSLAEADDIRKAMGKKEAKYIKPYRDRFVKNAVEAFPDIDEKRAEEIWQLMETFSGYGFNKSHSMSYALIGYICQYLKTHYSVEWWLACLKNATSTEHVSKYYNSTSLIRLPDINQSTDDYFITDDGKIQMPLTVVKGVGDGANAEICSKRPFRSFADFFDRVNKTKVNKKVVTQLIFAGAFQSLDEPDKAKTVAKYYNLRREKLPGEYDNITRNGMINFEADALDFIVPNYYELFPEAFPSTDVTKYSDFKQSTHGVNPKKEWDVGGQVTLIKPIQIKKGANEGKCMYRITITNAGEQMQIVIWPENWEFFSRKVKVGEVLKVKGRVKFYHDVVQMDATNILTVEEAMK